MSNVELAKVSPANTAKQSRERIPMSLPLQKLAVPEIPGFHCHWMLGEARCQQALRAGYEFVDSEVDGVDLVNTGLADDASKTGNSDMGSRVSVSAGSEMGSDGQGVRLYLMKLRNEWWEEDQKLLEKRNEQVAAAIRGGKIDATNPDGTDARYIPKDLERSNSNILVPKNRRS